MLLKIISPRIELADHIDTFWLFESDFGVPIEDNMVIAPNGKAKFIFPYKNALSTTLNGVKTDYKEQDIYFIGIWDRPVTLSSYSRVTGTIGIELKPNGVHRFAKISMLEVANRIFSFTDIYGEKGRRLIEILGNEESALKKIDILQDFLVKMVCETQRGNSIIDYTVDYIKSSSGLVEINQLEKKTGYSKRYLDLLFKDHLGISPKTLASITRFQSFYKAWANEDSSDFYKDNLYDVYYDQAHFIKEFKRFTGYTPKKYASDRNEFGKIFYKR